MTKISPDVYSAALGEVIRIIVRSVNFDINADFDSQLKIVSQGQFSKTGELTMGNADTTFAIVYNFPDPMPAGGKYTRTVTGPGGFTDGPFDVLQPGSEPNVVLTYVIKLAAAAGAPGGNV
jgi:hypothetical protein